MGTLYSDLLQKMLILNRSLTRISRAKYLRFSTQAVTDSETQGKRKQSIVNFKYGPAPSDPLYEHLLYSTEVEVYLTAKKGKAWLEMQAAKKFQADNEKRERERAAAAHPVPLALQYLYDESQRVQKEEDVTANEEIDVEDELSGHLEAGQTVFPYAQYDPVNSEEISENIDNIEQGSDQSKRGRGRRGRRKVTTEAPEETSDGDPKVEFDNINDSEHSQEIRQLFTEDHLFKYGTANPDAPGSSTNIPCGGCGAHLHCNDEKIPGFVPSQILLERRRRELRSVLCQRCYFIKEYKVALKLNVSPEDYPKAIEHIKDEKALILLVVDLLDFPGSVWPGILELMGKNKKVILVGNKFDLLVPDTKNYYKRITNLLRTQFLDKCWSESTENSVFPQIIGTCCVSATSGYNVEKLIEMVFNNWKNHNDALPGNIYIVGCTNVGKSSLFNTLLDSDLCKVSALHMVEKAMISPVPGTTLNLLKFPVTRPEPHFLANRRRRLRLADTNYRKMEVERLKMLTKEKDVMLSVPSHYTIKHTLLEKVKSKDDNDVEETDGRQYANTLELEQVPGLQLPDRLDPDERQWGKHCHDTPGTVSHDQIINLLTAEEVASVLTTRPLQPRTFLLKQGQTLLLGGLARIDLVTNAKEHHPSRVTVFCSRDLPINIVNTRGVEQFLSFAMGRGLLKVPQTKRPEFPELLGRELSVTGLTGSGVGNIAGGNWRGAADIVLSSVGWVMVCPRQGEETRWVAWTPGGRGIVAREPFLPNAINYRGKRIIGTPTFRNNNVYEPLNGF